MRLPELSHLLLLSFGLTLGACAHAPSTAVEKEAQVGAMLMARDETGNPVSLRVDQIEKDPKDPFGELLLYTVSVERSTSPPAWENYCRPDREGQTKAIPVSGYWDDTGKYHDDSSVVTIACTSGVIAKCIRWGYRPWASFHGRALRPFHLACVRMARADYCGDGKFHTREGTPIDVYDQVGVQKRETTSKMAFEAGWSEEGATYINRTRWFDTFEDLRKECPQRMKGRLREGQAPLSRQEILERWPETLIWNDSIPRGAK